MIKKIRVMLEYNTYCLWLYSSTYRRYSDEGVYLFDFGYS